MHLLACQALHDLLLCLCGAFRALIKSLGWLVLNENNTTNTNTTKPPPPPPPPPTTTTTTTNKQVSKLAFYVRLYQGETANKQTNKQTEINNTPALYQRQLFQRHTEEVIIIVAAQCCLNLQAMQWAPGRVQPRRHGSDQPAARPVSGAVLAGTH